MGFASFYKVHVINSEDFDINNSDTTIFGYEPIGGVEDRISYEYPNTLFMIQGKDEKGVWREYIKNGKCKKVYAKIIFDEFNENIFD